jgi:hypothetical protein
MPEKKSQADGRSKNLPQGAERLPSLQGGYGYIHNPNYTFQYGTDQGALIVGTGGISGMYYPALGDIAPFVNQGENGVRPVIPPDRASGDNITRLLAGIFALNERGFNYRQYCGVSLRKHRTGRERLNRGGNQGENFSYCDFFHLISSSIRLYGIYF